MAFYSAEEAFQTHDYSYTANDSKACYSTYRTRVDKCLYGAILRFARACPLLYLQSWPERIGAKFPFFSGSQVLI